MSHLLFALVVAIAGNSLAAQSASVRPAAFDSVTIRASAPADRDRGFVTRGGLLSIRATPLRAIIATLYDVDDRQLAGGPLWIDDEPFDIEAAARSAASADELIRLAKAMLADRFRLSLRSEMRELPVYELTMARTDRRLGSGITRTAGSCRGGRVGERSACDTDIAPGSIAATGTTIPAFAAKHLAPLLDRLIVDRTSLPGRFDIILRVASGELGAASVLRPRLFAEVEAQLGLKLRATSGSVPVLIVDHVERPTSN